MRTIQIKQFESVLLCAVDTDGKGYSVSVWIEIDQSSSEEKILFLHIQKQVVAPAQKVEIERRKKK